jgi:uncharacterized protein (TIGR03437 family)
VNSLPLAVFLGILTAVSSVAQPSVSALQNNYSRIPPGLPDYGIAQGSIFVMYGDRMGPPQLVAASSFPLTTTLGGVSIAVTGSDGRKYQAIPYYVSATQTAAILPSATPVGPATITVTYAGQTSAALPFSVLKIAFGVLTMNGAGSGAAAALDASSNFLGPANAAHPGEVVALWGTGLGPASGDETALGGTAHDLGGSVPITVSIGGRQAAVQYHGRSQYPGVDRIDVTVPSGVSGCYAAVQAQGDSIVSNLVTIPVAAGRLCTDPPVDYSYTPVQVENTIEHRFYAGQQQFMTVVMDSHNAIAIRPHPGLDANGWGSSLYLEPFLPGATLHGTTIQSITANSGGIEISVSGVVSRGGSSNYGTWNGNYTFSYNSGQKTIAGSGTYNIDLSGVLSSNTGDLNLYKLASNYLVNVPLLGGGTGSTGDMLQVNVSGGPFFGFTWIPSQGSAYPQDHRNPISVEVVGNYNRVDTAAQGYAAIAAAYKPTVKVILSCADQAGFTLIFGGAYDFGESLQYWQDNVAITPLVLKSSTLTSYRCYVTFDSTALAGDH